MYIQLLPSYELEVNIESCQPLRGLTVLLYRNYCKMFMTGMFCYAEHSKMISSIENKITEPD